MLKFDRIVLVAGSRFLVSLHETAVADHIGSENGRKPPFHTLIAHGTPPDGIKAV